MAMTDGEASISQPEIMTIQEARELMPATTRAMSDKEVVYFINTLDLLAGAIIEMVQNKDIIQSKHSI